MKCGSFARPGASVNQRFPDHCCPYNVNQNVPYVPPVAGASEKYGGGNKAPAAELRWQVAHRGQ